MTSDERAFLNAIRDQPADDTARLVYADWLTENGRPDRGEFIRIDIELARTPPTTEDDERRRRVLLERRAVLLKQHKSVWLAPFLPYATETAFVRGFVQSLDVPANSFLQRAEQWFALTPLTRVKITSMWEPSTRSDKWWVRPLLSSPLLAELEAVDLESLRLDAGDCESLAAHADLPRLRELALAVNELGTAGATLLANMPQLRHVESLDLRGNGISDGGARAIAQSVHLSGLKELRMSRNPIRNRTWGVLEERFGSALVG